jgi:hypothetical protein
MFCERADCADFLATGGLPDILPIVDGFPTEQQLAVGSHNLGRNRCPLRVALYPTLPRMLNETSITTPSAIQSFLHGIYGSSVSCSAQLARMPGQITLLPVKRH